MKLSLLAKGRAMLSLLLLLTAVLTMACTTEEAPCAMLSTEKVNYDPTAATGTVITITTDVAWKVITNHPLLTVTPQSGIGNGQITITGAPRNKSSILTILIGSGHNVATRTIEVTSQFADPVYAWAEVPADAVSKGDFVVGTHWTTTATTKQRVRNYTFCYDTRRHCPLWVAHPQHDCYMEADGEKRDDKWTKDPYLTDDQSAIMYPFVSVSTNARSLFSATSTLLEANWPESNKDGIQWTRGHMLQSACRPGRGREINLQTCQSSNIAPQKGKAFDKLWAAAEEKIRKEYVCSDTLYYVSGAFFENETIKAKDGYASSKKEFLDVSKECVVPTHYYKVLLRTKSGKTGKPVQTCQADELQAVGFWFTHADMDPVSKSLSPSLSKAYMLSVKDLEAKTGLVFFPEIPAEVKASFSAADWKL